MYIPDKFEPVALIKNNQVFYYHLDQLSTPQYLTNELAELVWQNNSDAFGKANEENSKEKSIKQPIRFQGQYFDTESGLHYNRFRYYCPKQQRFIHQDPIGLIGGINHYQYAPNPVNWVDPLGLSCKEGDIDVSDVAIGSADLIAIGVVNTAIDVVAGGAGLVTLAISGGNIDAATHTIESVQKNQIGPLTDSGLKISKRIAPIVQEYYEDNMAALGDTTHEVTGSPTLATLAHKSVEIVGTMAGGKTILNSAKGLKIDLKVPEYGVLNSNPIPIKISISPDLNVTKKIAKLDLEGHAPIRHGGPNRITDIQLQDRAVKNIDPASGTTFDAFNKFPDGSPKPHKVGRNATAFTSDTALVQADDFVRKSNIFKENITAARANGDLFVDAIDIPLKDIFVGNYQDSVRGFSRLGSKKNPTGYTQIDFTGGTVKAIYRLDHNGNVKLHTLYPNP